MSNNIVHNANGAVRIALLQKTINYREEVHRNVC